MRRFGLSSSLLLAGLLSACNAPQQAEEPPATPEQPAAPFIPTPDPGCGDCNLPDQPTPDPVAPPSLGALTLRRTQQVLLGGVQTSWSVDVALRSAQAPTPVGPCRLTQTGGATSSLDAGDLEVRGGAYPTLRLARDAETGEYDLAMDEDDASDGTLFQEDSQLRLVAAGGEVIQSLAQQGTWTGVRHLEFQGPLTLETLPRDELQLSWVAAPSAGAAMEVSLRAPDLRIDCPVSGDPGAFTVPAEVLAALPPGPVYIEVERVSGATALAAPDAGAVRLESRSGWRIMTTK